MQFRTTKVHQLLQKLLELLAARGRRDRTVVAIGVGITTGAGGGIKARSPQRSKCRDTCAAQTGFNARGQVGHTRAHIGNDGNSQANNGPCYHNEIHGDCATFGPKKCIDQRFLHVPLVTYHPENSLHRQSCRHCGRLGITSGRIAPTSPNPKRFQQKSIDCLGAESGQTKRLKQAAQNRFPISRHMSACLSSHPTA
jgi:hypothetical protein